MYVSMSSRKFRACSTAYPIRGHGEGVALKAFNKKEKRYKELYSLDRSLSAYYSTNSVLISISTKYEIAMQGTVDFVVGLY